MIYNLLVAAGIVVLMICGILFAMWQAAKGKDEE